MNTLNINTEKELKELVLSNRESITSINGVTFGNVYPMLEVSNKHASYYDSASQSNKYLSSPFIVTTNAR